MRDTDLAWMAGVFDCLGRIVKVGGPKRSTPQYRLVVQSAKAADVIDRLCQMTGVKSDGRLSHMKYDRRQCDVHCPEKHQHVNAVYRSDRWVVGGAAALIVAKAIHPFIQLQAESIAKFIVELEGINPLKLDGPGKAAVNKSISRLRELGWDVDEEAS